MNAQICRRALAIAVSIAIVVLLYWPESTQAGGLSPGVLSNHEVMSTLRNIYYHDNDLPPEPDSEERRAYLYALENHLSAHEREFLDGALADVNFRILAMRDSDGDGLPDYRIADNGKFVENDTDVDGDNTLNVMDDRPYFAGNKTADSNRNEIPDHIDWALEKNGDPAMAPLQQRFYSNHNVILVNRSAGFDAGTIDTLYDLIDTIFSPEFKRLGSLTTIAAEKVTQREEPSSTLADVFGQNNTMTVYIYPPEKRAGHAIFDLGVLAHELIHLFQFAEDRDCPLPWTKRCDDADFEELKRYNIYRSPAFHAIISKPIFGWQVCEHIESKAVYPYVVPHDGELSPCWYYKGLSTAAWETILAHWWNTAADTDSYWEQMQSRNIVGEYSLSNPWEWQADYAIAYLFLSMEKYAKRLKKYSDSEWQSVRSCFEKEVRREWNDGFSFRPAADNHAVMRWFGTNYHGRGKEWRYLTRKYLLSAYDQYCTPG